MGGNIKEVLTLVDVEASIDGQIESEGNANYQLRFVKNTLVTRMTTWAQNVKSDPVGGFALFEPHFTGSSSSR